MTTKLDDLVGYLAGRDGEPRLLDELAEPDSEINRFLEAARTKSRALIAEPVASKARPKRSTVRTSNGIGLGIGIGLLLAALLVAGWSIDLRLRQIEANQRDRDAEARASVDHLESAVNQLLENHEEPGGFAPINAAIARVDGSLEKLQRQIQELDRAAMVTRPEPVAAQVLENLTALRHEIAASEKAKMRQAEELQSSLHEVSRLLRLLVNRTPAIPAPNGNPADPPRN
jgi:hypothetical protein